MPMLQTSCIVRIVARSIQALFYVEYDERTERMSYSNKSLFFQSEVHRLKSRMLREPFVLKKGKGKVFPVHAMKAYKVHHRTGHEGPEG